MLKLKLKAIQTKPVIYQGLEVDVPVDTNFMWLRHTPKKTVLLASAKKPVWNADLKVYIPTAETNLVAVLEHADLTVEQVIDSLETDESLPTAQDLEKLDVVKNLVKNLHSFANSLERNVTKASINPSPESIQSLLQHVYADEGELDNFYNHAIEEATEYGIVAEQDEDSDEDHEALLKFVNAVFK
ncbi:MAG: hypothetical protein RR575_00005 [Acinetobacter sp.]